MTHSGYAIKVKLFFYDKGSRLKAKNMNTNLIHCSYKNTQETTNNGIHFDKTKILIGLEKNIFTGRQFQHSASKWKS